MVCSSSPARGRRPSLFRRRGNEAIKGPRKSRKKVRIIHDWTENQGMERIPGQEIIRKKIGHLPQRSPQHQLQYRSLLHPHSLNLGKQGRPRQYQRRTLKSLLHGPNQRTLMTGYRFPMPRNHQGNLGRLQNNYRLTTVVRNLDRKTASVEPGWTNSTDSAT
jgi:hypothetical protein